MHGESTTATTATVEGWEGEVERGWKDSMEGLERGSKNEREGRISKNMCHVVSIPLHGYKEGGEEDKAVKDWLGQGRRGSEAVRPSCGKIGRRRGCKGIHVRREVTAI